MAWTKQKVYVWYVCLVAATTMILYGYDSSTFNAIQGSPNWKEYFHNPGPNVIGSVNTAYTVGGIVAGKYHNIRCNQPTLNLTLQASFSLHPSPIDGVAK